MMWVDEIVAKPRREECSAEGREPGILAVSNQPRSRHCALATPVAPVPQPKWKNP